MEKGNGGVNEERVTRDEKSNDPVGKLEEASTGHNRKQLGALVEQYLEQNREGPQEQSGQEEGASLAVQVVVALARCSCHVARRTE